MKFLDKICRFSEFEARKGIFISKLILIEFTDVVHHFIVF
jgi:hypothetical protein